MSLDNYFVVILLLLSSLVVLHCAYYILYERKCLRILLCGVCAVGYSWYVRASTRDRHGPRICGIQTGISFVGLTIRDCAYILY